MKIYEDKKISFSYPDEFKLSRAKQKWGQYGLEKKIEKKKTILIIIQLVEDEAFHTIKRLMCDCPFDEFNVGEYYESVTLGGKEGRGLVVTIYDFEHNFIQKRYQYLFPISTGGLYLEIIGGKEFTIDSYKEILESITVKEAVSQN